MTGQATIGALNVMLGLDSSQFVGGLRAAQGQLRRAGREMAAVGKQLSEVGRNLTLGMTVPLGAFGIATVKAAANFESSMIKVGISTKATTAQMAEMEASARAIGKATVFSASEAADAMDMLAKTGLGVDDILGGAAKAAVDLAAATGSELEPAAAAISDSMQQFKLTASQLPGVVDQITGAVNESKLSFEDFAAASGQSGGVAAALGVTFQDFNAVLAGTSSLFASGSDAGTSFKTFLTTLTPKSNEAAAAMKAYGLSFFEANGSLKSMAEVAEELRTKLGGLNDQAKTQVLKDIFGTDAMRTAIGLMNQGAAGLDLVAKKIRETDAAAQSAKRMEGFNGQLKQLQGAFEDLGIAIGKSGILAAATDLVKGFARATEAAASLSPELMRTALGGVALLAAIGPVNIAVGAIAGGFSRALTAVSALTAGAGGLRVAMTAMGALIGPGGLIVAGLAAAAAVTFALVAQFKAQRTAAAEVTAQTDKLAKAVDDYTAAANLSSTASGAARVQFLQEAAAKRELAIQTRADTVAKLNNAKATLAQLEADTARAMRPGFFDNVNAENPAAYASAQGARLDKAQANVAKFRSELERTTKEIDRADKVIAAGSATVTTASVASAAATNTKADALKREKDTREDAIQALREYLAAEQKLSAEVGLSQNEIKAREAVVNALKAQIAGEAELSKQLWDVAEAYRIGDIEFQKLNETQVDFVNTTADLKVEFKSTWDLIRARTEEATDRFRDAAYAVDDIYYGFKNRDWAGGFAGLFRALEQLKFAFSSTGSAADRMAALNGLGQGLAGAVGGKTGQAIGGGLGLATAGAGISGLLAGGGLAAGLANGVVGLGGSVALAGSLSAGLMTVGAMLGPIGAIAGVAYAAAKLFNLGGKPSNAGAGYDLRTGAITGDKRTSDTEQAAKSAGAAIQEIEAGLKAAGIGLVDTVTGLVIGTRDQTQIYLQSGKTLKSAVGDAGAAADAAMRALLEGATYASEAQEKLVKSMVAAGKGFDQISAALATYAEAQKLGDNIGDEILRLTDPKAYDLDQLQDAQAERRKSLQAFVDEGFITAEQLAKINVQLGRLEDLELDEVLKKYGEGVLSLADVQARWDEKIAASQAKVTDAQDDALDAYEREIDAAEDFRDGLEDVAASLADFRRELTTGALGGLDPQQQLAVAQAAFDAIAGKTDADSLAKLPEVGRALIEAQRAVAPNAQVLNTTTNAVRAAVIAGEAAARAQVSEAQRQIDALTQTATALGLLNTNLVSFGGAQAKLGEAIAAHADVLKQAAAAIAAAGAAMTAATAAAAAIVASPPPPAPDPVWPADLTAAMDAASFAAASSASDAQSSKLLDSLRRLEELQRQTMANTGETARQLDDANYFNNQP